MSARGCMLRAGGVSTQGDVCSGGGQFSQGESLLRSMSSHWGVCPGEGVSAWRVSAQWGCLPRGMFVQGVSA